MRVCENLWTASFAGDVYFLFVCLTIQCELTGIATAFGLLAMKTRRRRLIFLNMRREHGDGVRLLAMVCGCGLNCSFCFMLVLHSFPGTFLRA